jgi:hypothetical protein
MDLSSLLMNGGFAAMVLWSPATNSDALRPFSDWTTRESSGAERLREADYWIQPPTPESVGYFVLDMTGDAGSKLTMRQFPGIGKTGEFLGVYQSALLHETPLVIPFNVASNPMDNSLDSPHVKAVRWIQGATGLSDGRVAQLLGVSRKTILDWKSGTLVRDSNRQVVLETQDILKRAARHYDLPEGLVTWLYTPDPDDGIAPFKLLQEREFDRARYLAVQTPTEVDPVPDWAKRPIAPGWQDAVEELERSGEFEMDIDWNDL